MTRNRTMQTDTDLLLFEIRRWCSPSQFSMFNLMSNCCSWVSKLQQPNRKVTVLVVGLEKAGKTSCIRGMLRAPHGEVGPTRECVCNELRVENFLVNLLDVGGSPEVRPTWREHYGEAHGVIFVVDCNDKHRMKEAKELLSDMLRHPRVAGKPLLVLANKQDKMNALLGSELIEVLSLEKLVNQSRSLCHIEPCSALMDSRRWSDRKSLRGLRWLLRAVCLDYSELCERVVRDCKRALGSHERDNRRKAEKLQKKNKVERIKTSKSDCQVQCPMEKALKTGSTLRPISGILKKENSFQRKLKKNDLKVNIKKRKVKRGRNEEGREGQRGEVAEGNEAEQHHSNHDEKASSTLPSQKSGKLKPKANVKVETLDHTKSLDKDDSKVTKEKGGKKKKKKVVKVKRKNRINTEEPPIAYRQPADLSATFDLYRKAILALKARQEQSLMPEQ